MSFAITVEGTPAEIKQRLAEEGQRLTDQSKQEFDAVRPALETLVDQNVGDGARLSLEASGHAVFANGATKTSGQVQVTLKRIAG